MPNKTGIEYVQYTSNPIRAVHLETGKQGHHCVKISPLCAHCYAEALNKRWGTGLPFTIQSEAKIKFILAQKELDDLARLDARLLKRGETARVFLGDMTDIFQRRIPQFFLFAVLDALRELKALTVLLLTKRVEEMLTTVADYGIKRGLHDDEFRRAFPHVHMGVSVGIQSEVDRFVPLLLLAPFDVRWLSIEPLLEAVNLTQVGHGDQCGLNALTGEFGFYCDGGLHSEWGSSIDWVVVGGESGNGARPSHPDWFRSLRDQCATAGIPFFFKQHGNYLHQSQKYSDGLTSKECTDICTGRNAHHWPDGTKSQFINKKAAGRLLDGRTWDEFPKTVAEVR